MGYVYVESQDQVVQETNVQQIQENRNVQKMQTPLQPPQKPQMLMLCVP